MKTFEFFITDLTEEAQARFIEFLGGDNGNHDVIPFATYDQEEEVKNNIA